MRQIFAIGAMASALLMTGEAASVQYSGEFSIDLRARVMTSCAVISVEPASMAGIDGLELQTVCNSEHFQISLRNFDENLQIGQVSSMDAQVTSVAQHGVINVRLYTPGTQRIFIETPDAQSLAGMLSIDLISI